MIQFPDIPPEPPALMRQDAQDLHDPQIQELQKQCEQIMIDMLNQYAEGAPRAEAHRKLLVETEFIIEDAQQDGERFDDQRIRNIFQAALEEN